MHNYVIDWAKTGLLAVILIATFIFYYYRKTITETLSNWFFAIVFNEKEAETIQLAIEAKQAAKKYWYINNIITPIIILYLPYILTLVSEDFHIINFKKSLVQLTLTGAFSMIGINVMRTNLTLVNETIKPTHIEDKSIFEGLLKDIESIKSKIRSWILLLTLLGTLAYFIQVGNFMDTNNSNITPYLIAAIILFTLSVFFGRLISIVQTNFADDESKVRAWVNSLAKKQSNDFSSLKEETKGGLL